VKWTSNILPSGTYTVSKSKGVDTDVCCDRLMQASSAAERTSSCRLRACPGRICRERLGIAMVNAVEQRLAELWTISKQRDLTEKEMYEIGQCLEWLANDVWKRVKLENLSLLASMTNDTDWQYEVCRRIDELQTPGVKIIRARKKPGPKGTD